MENKIGRVVLITGAAGGLGAAMTIGLAKAGARVAAIDHPKADSAVSALVDGARAAGVVDRILPLRADVTNAASCAGAVASAIEHFGRVDALINNAGVHIDIVTPYVMSGPPKFYETSAEQWRLMMDVNVNGPFNMALAAAPHFLANNFGRIVNVTTGYRVMVRGGSSAYGPSKAALEAATAVWSADFSGTGITVNALSPGGAADTAMVPAIDVPDRTTLLHPSTLIAPAAWMTLEAPDSFNGRRITARLWNADASLDNNLRASADAAAWGLTG